MPSTDQPDAVSSVDVDALTSEQRTALHWAADALRVVEACKERGGTPTGTAQINADRYRVAARAHGFTDEQVRAYLKTLPRPTA
jgi:hypothetical protein